MFQALEWIHDTGEFYLSTHTNVGENLTETESLLKEHNEFKVTAKVSTHLIFKVEKARSPLSSISRSRVQGEHLTFKVSTFQFSRSASHFQGQEFKVTSKV